MQLRALQGLASGKCIPPKRGAGREDGILIQGAHSSTNQPGTEDSTQLARNAAAEGRVHPGVCAAIETSDEHEEGEGWTWNREKEQVSIWRQAQPGFSP